MHIYIYIGVVKTLTIKQWLFKNWCPSWSDCGSKLMLIQFKVIHNSEYEYTLDLDLPPLVSAVCGCGFAASVCWFPHPSLLPQDPHGLMTWFHFICSMAAINASDILKCAFSCGWRTCNQLKDFHDQFGEKVKNPLSTTEWKAFSMCIHTCKPS